MTAQQRLYGLCAKKDGHYTTAEGKCKVCGASLTEVIELLIALHEALNREEAANDGEWESAEVSALRQDLAEFVKEHK